MRIAGRFLLVVFKSDRLQELCETLGDLLGALWSSNRINHYYRPGLIPAQIESEHFPSAISTEKPEAGERLSIEFIALDVYHYIHTVQDKPMRRQSYASLASM
jgi:hypothetical protein